MSNTFGPARDWLLNVFIAPAVDAEAKMNTLSIEAMTKPVV
ncbi:hypothetical protein [Thiomonas sp. FB-Cd]|nr:hypothetical protein [Thiomonas sp. FB-Cd]